MLAALKTILGERTANTVGAAVSKTCRGRTPMRDTSFTEILADGLAFFRSEMS